MIPITLISKEERETLKEWTYKPWKERLYLCLIVLHWDLSDLQDINSLRRWGKTRVNLWYEKEKWVENTSVKTEGQSLYLNFTWHTTWQQVYKMEIIVEWNEMPINVEAKVEFKFMRTKKYPSFNKLQASCKHIRQHSTNFPRLLGK